MDAQACNVGILINNIPSPFATVSGMYSIKKIQIFLYKPEIHKYLGAELVIKTDPKILQDNFEEKPCTIILWVPRFRPTFTLIFDNTKKLKMENCKTDLWKKKVTDYPI